MQAFIRLLIVSLLLFTSLQSTTNQNVPGAGPRIIWNKFPQLLQANQGFVVDGFFSEDGTSASTKQLTYKIYVTYEGINPFKYAQYFSHEYTQGNYWENMDIVTVEHLEKTVDTIGNQELFDFESFIRFNQKRTNQYLYFNIFVYEGSHMVFNSVQYKKIYYNLTPLLTTDNVCVNSNTVIELSNPASVKVPFQNSIFQVPSIKRNQDRYSLDLNIETTKTQCQLELVFNLISQEQELQPPQTDISFCMNDTADKLTCSATGMCVNSNSTLERQGCQIVTDSQNLQFYRCDFQDPVSNLSKCSIGYKEGADPNQFPSFNSNNNQSYNMEYYMMKHKLDQTKYSIGFYEIKQGLTENGQLKPTYVHYLLKDSTGQFLYFRNEIKFQITDFQSDYSFEPVDIQVNSYVHWKDGFATVTGGINNDQITKDLENPTFITFAATFNVWGNMTESAGQILETKTAIELGAQATNRVDNKNIWSILDLYRLNVTISGDQILPLTSFSVLATGTNGEIFSKHASIDNIRIMVPSIQEKEQQPTCFEPTYKLKAPDDTEFAQSPYIITDVFAHLTHPRQNYTLHISPTGTCDYKLVYAKLSIKQEWTEECQYCQYGTDAKCNKYQSGITCSGTSPNYQCLLNGQPLSTCEEKTDNTGKIAVRCNFIDNQMGKTCSMIAPEGSSYQASELDFGFPQYQQKTDIEQYLADWIYEYPKGFLNLSPYFLAVLKNVTSNFYLHTIWYSQSENTAKYVQKPMMFEVGYDFSKFAPPGGNGDNQSDPCEFNHQANQAQKANFVFNSPLPKSAIKWGDALTLNANLATTSEATEIKVVVSYIDRAACSRAVETNPPYLLASSSAINNMNVPFDDFVEIMIKKPEIENKRLTYVAVGQNDSKVYHSHSIWVQPPLPQNSQTKPACLTLNLSATDENQAAMNTGTNGEFLINSQQYKVVNKTYNFQINLQGAGVAGCPYELIRTRLTTYQNLSTECKANGQCGSVNNACATNVNGHTCTKANEVWTCQIDGVTLNQSREVTDINGVKHVRSQGYNPDKNLDGCVIKLAEGTTLASFAPEPEELEYYDPISQTMRDGESKEIVGLYKFNTTMLEDLYNKRQITEQSQSKKLWIHSAIKNTETGKISYSVGQANIIVQRGVVSQCNDYNQAQNAQNGEAHFVFANGLPKTIVDFGSGITLTARAKSDAAQFSAGITYFDNSTCTRTTILPIELDVGATSFDNKMIPFNTIFETLTGNQDKHDIRLSFKAVDATGPHEFHMNFDFLPPHPEFVSKQECFTMSLGLTDPKSQPITPNTSNKYLIKLRDYDLAASDLFDLNLTIDTSNATGDCNFTPIFSKVVKYSNPRSECMEKNECGGFSTSCMKEGQVPGFNCEVSPSLACTLNNAQLDCQIIKNVDETKSFGKCKIDDPGTSMEKCIIDTQGDTAVMFKKDDEQNNYQAQDNIIWKESYLSPTSFKVSMNSFTKLWQNDPEQFKEGNFNIWTVLKNQSTGSYIYYETKFDSVVDRRTQVVQTDVIEDKSKFQVTSLKSTLEYKQNEITIAKIVDDLSQTEGGSWLIRANLLVDGQIQSTVNSQYGAIFDQALWNYVDLVYLLEPLGFEAGVQTNQPEFKIQLVAVDPQGNERYSYTTEKLIFRAAPLATALSTDNCKIDTIEVTSSDGRAITKSSGDGNRFIISKSTTPDVSKLTVTFSKSGAECTQDTTDIIYSDIRPYRDDNLGCKMNSGECAGAPDIACSINNDFICTDNSCVSSTNEQCTSTNVTDQDSNIYNRCDFDLPSGSKKCIIALQTGQTQPNFAPQPESVYLTNPMNAIARLGRQDQKTYILKDSEVEPISKINEEYVKFYYHVYQSNTNKDDIYYNIVEFELAFVDTTARLIQTQDMKANLYLSFNDVLKVRQNVALSADAKLQGYSKISATVKVVKPDQTVQGSAKKKQFSPAIDKITSQTQLYKYGQLFQIALSNQIYFSKSNTQGSALYLYFIAQGGGLDPREQRATQQPIYLLPPVAQTDKQESIACITPQLSLTKTDGITQVKHQKTNPIEFNLWNVQNITTAYSLKLSSAYQSCSKQYKLLGVSVRAYQNLAQGCQSFNECQGAPNEKCHLTPLTCTPEGSCTDEVTQVTIDNCSTVLIENIDYYRCELVDQRTDRTHCIIDSSKGNPTFAPDQERQSKFNNPFNFKYPMFTPSAEQTDAAEDFAGQDFMISEFQDTFERVNQNTQEIERNRFFANVFWTNPVDSTVSYSQISFEINPMQEDPKVEILSGGPVAAGDPVTISWGDTYTVSAKLSGVEDFTEWKLYTAILEYGLEYSSNQYGLVQKDSFQDGYDTTTGIYQKQFTSAEVLQKISYNKDPVKIGVILDSPRHDNKLQEVQASVDIYLIPPAKVVSDSATCEELKVQITTSTGEVATFDEVSGTFSLEQLPTEGKLEIKVTGSIPEGSTSCGNGSTLKKAFLRTFDDLSLQCLKTQFCNEREVTPEEDAKLQNFLNGVFGDRADSNFSASITNQILISIEQHELQYGLKDPNTKELQQIFLHSFWVKSSDNSMVYKNFSFKIDVKSSTQTDITCDANFCDLRMYPFINGLDASDMWGCDAETRKWGGKIPSFNRGWKEDVKIQLIPDLSQCQINYLDFLNQQTQVYDWAALRTKLNNDELFNRMRTGWSIKFGYNTNESPIILGQDQAIETVLTESFLAENFKYNKYSSQDSVEICNWFDNCDYKVCYYVLLPSYNAPAQNPAVCTDAQVAIEIIQNGKKIEPSQQGDYQIEETEPFEVKVVSVDQCHNGAEVFDVFVRTYADLQKEAGLRNKSDQVSNSQCYQEPMDCVQDGNNKFNCSTMYQDFTGCENVTDLNNVTTIKCVKVSNGGFKHCSIKQPNAVIPQKDDKWKMCFDPGTWDNCPIEASCVPCADHKNEGQEDCVATETSGYSTKEFNCPTYKAGTNCQDYYDYINEFRYKKTDFSWTEFEPYKKENFFFERSSFRTQDRKGVKIGQLKDMNRYQNYSDDYSSTQIDYQIPQNGLQFNLHIMMKYPNPAISGDMKIEYVSKAITVKRLPSLIDNSGYTINFRMNREVPFDSPLISNSLKTGYNANLLPIEAQINYKNNTSADLDKEQYAAGQKMYYLPYHRYEDSNTVKIKLLNNNYKTVAEAQMNLLVIPESVPTSPLFSCIQITNSIKYEGKKDVTYRNNRMQLYQNVSISGEFFFNFDNCPGQTQYNLSQMTLRTFANLTEECPIRKTCAPMNQTCSYQVMYCNDEFKETITTDSRGNQKSQIKSQYVCYDLNGGKWDTCKKSTDQNGNTYTRCDSSAYNPAIKGTEYNCTIALPSNSEIAPTHPLVNENCKYAADAAADSKDANCDLNKGCIDQLKLYKNLLNSTSCQLNPQLLKIRFFFTNNPFHTFSTDQKYRQSANDQFENIATFQGSRFEIPSKIWANSQGEATSFFHFFFVDAQNPANMPQYTRLEMPVYFASTDKPDPIWASLALPEGEKWHRRVDFGAELTLTLTVTGIDTAENQGDYKVRVFIPGVEKPTQIDSGATFTITAEDILKIYGYSRWGADFSTGSMSYSFAAFNSRSKFVFDRVWLQVVINEPTTLTESLKASTVTYDIKYDDGVNGKKDTNQKWYVSGDRVTTLDYTVNFSENDYKILDIEVRDFQDLTGDCGSRGTCAIPINRCSVQIMNCVPGQNNKYTCTNLYGSTIDTCTLQTDQNNFETYRCDFNEWWCGVKDIIRKHPLDITEYPQDLQNISGCYAKDQNTCPFPVQCLNQQQQETASNISTTEVDCTFMWEYMSKYHSAVSDHLYTDYKIEYWNQFDWSISQQNSKFNDYLGSQYYDRSNTRSIFYNYWQPETNGVKTFYIHIFASKNGNVGYVRKQLQVNYWKSDPTSAYQATFSVSKEQIPWGEGIDVTASTDNFDPTISINIRATVFSEWASLFLDQNSTDNQFTISGSSLSVNAADTLKAFGYSRYGGQGSIEFQVVSDDGQNIGAPKWLSPKLLGPIENQRTDCSHLSVVGRFKDANSDIALDGNALVIDLDSLETGKDIKLTLTGYDHVDCSQNSQIYQIMGRTYSDLSKDQDVQDPLKNKENCFPTRLANVNGEWYDMNMNYKYDSCNQEADFTGQTFVVCSTGDYCVVKDTANQHFVESPDYSKCADPAQKSQCPILPYCLDYREDPFTYLNEDLIKVYGWTLQQLVDKLKVRELLPKVKWDEVIADIGNSKTDVFKTVFEKFDVKLEDVIKEANPWSQCDVLYQTGGFYSTYNTPKKWQNDPNATSNSVIPEWLENELQYAFWQGDNVGEFYFANWALWALMKQMTSYDTPFSLYLHILTTTSTDTGYMRKQVPLKLNRPKMIPKISSNFDAGATIPSIGQYDAQISFEDYFFTTEDDYEVQWSCSAGLESICDEANSATVYYEQSFLSFNEDDIGNTSGAATFTATVTKKSTNEIETKSLSFIIQPITSDCDFDLTETEYQIATDEGKNKRKIEWQFDMGCVGLDIASLSFAFKLNGVQCSWCNNAGIGRKGTSNRWYVKVPISGIPANTEFVVDLEATYTVSSNPKTASKKISVFKQADPLVAYFEGSTGLIKGINGFKSEIKTNEAKNSSWRIRQFTECPANYSKCSKLQKKIDIPSTELQSLGLAEGEEYRFTAIIVTQDQREAEITNTFSVTFQPEITQLVVVPFVEKKWRVDNFGSIYFDLEPKDGTSWNLLWDLTYEWKVYKIEADKSQTELASTLFSTYDITLEVPQNTFQPGTKYRVKARATSSSGKTVSAGTRIKMAPQGKAGKVKIRSKDSPIDQFSSLKIKFNRFKKPYQYKIFCESNTDANDISIIAESTKRIFRKINLSPSSTHKCGWIFIDKFGWEQKGYFDVTIATKELSSVTDINTVINAENPSALLKNANNVKLHLGEDAYKTVQKSGRDFIENQINNNKLGGQSVIDADSLSQVAGSIQKMASLLDVAEETSKNTIFSAIGSITTAVQSASDSMGTTELKSTMESLGNMIMNFDSQKTTDSDKETSAKAKAAISKAVENTLGGVKYETATGEMEMKTFKNDQIRPNSVVSLGSSSSTSSSTSSSGTTRSPCEANIPADTFSQLTSSFGTTKVTASLTQQTPNAQIKASLQVDGNAVLDSVVEPQFAIGGSFIDLSSFTFTFELKFSVSTFLQNLLGPRLLQSGATTTTTYTPQCQRNDSVAGWTTDGVTTVQNADGTISCNTTKPGATSVVYVKSTITTGGTSNTTQTTDSSSSSSLNVGLIVGVTIAAVVVIAVIIVIIVVLKKKKQKMRFEMNKRIAPVKMVASIDFKQVSPYTEQTINYDSPTKSTSDNRMTANVSPVPLTASDLQESPSQPTYFENRMLEEEIKEEEDSSEQGSSFMKLNKIEGDLNQSEQNLGGKFEEQIPKFQKLDESQIESQKN